MNKRIKAICIIILTISICIIAYSQVLPIVIKHPSNDFKPIEITDAITNKQDNNMTLSFLYNITKEIHPVGTEANYRVKNYIENCLQKMNVDYEIQTRALDESFFESKKQEYIRKMADIKDRAYSEIKEHAGDKEVDEYLKEISEYNSFDDYFSNSIMNGSTIEEKAQNFYDRNMEQYNGKSLNNIFISLNKDKQADGQNILFVAHYDSDINSYGAGDDGIAVASLLETIRCTKDKNYMNNIYVLITDGEENNYWGAIEFIETTNIKFDLVANFDNSGNSGVPILYHYSNSSTAKQYFKSVKNESAYSFSNDIIFKYFHGDISDAFEFMNRGFNTLDFSLVGRPQNYHSNKDTFENIDINSLDNLTKTMISMVEYYGNNKIFINDNYKFVTFKIINGIQFSLNQAAYITISVILIIVNTTFIIFLFKSKAKIHIRILSILCVILSLALLIAIKCFSLLISIPLTIYFVMRLLKNKLAREISRIILYELYLLIVLQPIITIIQYFIWISLRS